MHTMSGFCQLQCMVQKLGPCYFTNNHPSPPPPIMSLIPLTFNHHNPFFAILIPSALNHTLHSSCIPYSTHVHSLPFSPFTNPFFFLPCSSTITSTQHAFLNPSTFNHHLISWFLSSSLWTTTSYTNWPFVIPTLFHSFWFFSPRLKHHPVFLRSLPTHSCSCSA